MGQYEKDKKELQEKIDQLEHKLKKAKQSGDKADVDKYSRKLADRRAKLPDVGGRGGGRPGRRRDDERVPRRVGQRAARPQVPRAHGRLAPRAPPQAHVAEAPTLVVATL